MGTYLSKPNTEKETQTGSSTKIKYASTSMQGWRVHQEDAHNCILNLVDGWSLFSVYDGHGGPEVAQYTAEKLPEFLKTDLFKDGEPIERNFQDVFIEYDDHLRGAEAMKKLQQIAGITKDNQDDNEEEVVKMFEESSLPVKALLEKYGVRLLRRNSDGMARSLEDGVEPEENEEEPLDDEENEEENEQGNGEEKEPIKTKKRPSTEKEVDECKRRKVEDENAENAEKKEETSEQVNDEDKDEKSNEVDESHAEGGSNGACGTTGEDDEDSDPSYREEDEESFDESEEELDEEDPETMEGGNMGGEVPGEDSGTTACVCLLSDSKIIVANIGDSRAVLCRDGKAIDLSVDHKPEDEAETKRIEKAGGKVTEDGRVNGGLNLSRAFGDHFYKKNTELPLADQMISALPDVITKELSPEDRFLIVACDGIWNSMESQQVVDYVKERLEKKRSLADIVEELCDSCMAENTAGDGTGCDNMTVILIDLQKAQDESQTAIL
ncbi:unnamed protein product, partial [Mesorhabditis belari]|uniref:protein-serine/threonine phosphatase n=1 Tax=Mesorhabditis belari TaxID=2138241 RepID=A0AAF3EAL3_9BILA